MSVNFQSSKEIFDPLEDIDKEILACFDVLGRLKTLDVRRICTST
jgi:hypothetical protein